MANFIKKLFDCSIYERYFVQILNKMKNKQENQDHFDLLRRIEKNSKESKCGAMAEL